MILTARFEHCIFLNQYLPNGMEIEFTPFDESILDINCKILKGIYDSTKIMIIGRYNIILSIVPRGSFIKSMKELISLAEREKEIIVYVSWKEPRDMRVIKSIKRYLIVYRNINDELLTKWIKKLVGPENFSKLNLENIITRVHSQSVDGIIEI